MVRWVAAGAGGGGAGAGRGMLRSVPEGGGVLLQQAGPLRCPCTLLPACYNWTVRKAINRAASPLVPAQSASPPARLACAHFASRPAPPRPAHLHGHALRLCRIRRLLGLLLFHLVPLQPLQAALQSHRPAAAHSGRGGQPQPQRLRWGASPSALPGTAPTPCPTSAPTPLRTASVKGHIDYMPPAAKSQRALPASPVRRAAAAARTGRAPVARVFLQLLQQPLGRHEHARVGVAQRGEEAKERVRGLEEVELAASERGGEEGRQG